MIGLKRMTLAIAIAAALAACGEREAKHDEHGEQAEAEGERGPHGGTLLRDGDFAVEVKIFEEGVPPEFRLYAYDGNKPIDVRELSAEMQLVRLDRTEAIRFTPRGDYLLGDREIVEPHSFDVALRIAARGEAHRIRYSQREGRTTFTAEQAREAGIVIETAGPARIRSTLALPGEIVLNADREAHVVARVDGVAARVLKNLGDRVARGDTLAVVESGAIANLRSDYLAALRRRELLRATAEREEALFNKKISSEEEYLRARNAHEEASIEVESAAQKLAAIGVAPAAAAEGALSAVALRSPLGGVVIAKEVTAGEAVTANESLFVIADLSSVWLDVNVAANHLPLVRVGQPVAITAPSSGATTTGRIAYVGSLVGGETRSARARVVLPNPRGEWRPGLFVNVQLTTDETTVPVAVRAEGLQTFRDWDVVFIQVGDEYEVRPLELGRRDESFVEVLSGLAAGQRYVAKSSFVLKADVLKAGASHDH